MLNDGGWVGGEEEFGGHWSTIVGQEGARLRSVEEGLVWRSEEVVGLLQCHVLRGLLRWKWSVIVVLNVDEVDSHLLGSLNTNNQWGTLTGCNDLVWVVDRLEEETEGALELGDDSLCENWELDVRVLVEDVLCELGNSLCVRLGLKFEALSFEQNLQFLVVGDDTIVDNGEFPFWVGSVRRVTVSELPPYKGRSAT